MAAFVPESENKANSVEKSSSKNGKSESKDVKLKCSEFLRPLAKQDELEFDSVWNMFMSSKAMVDGAIASKVVTRDDISLINKTIYLTHEGFKYRIEHSSYELDKDELAMEINLSMSTTTSESNRIFSNESMMCGLIAEVEGLAVVLMSLDNEKGTTEANKSTSSLCKLLARIIEKTFPDQWLRDL